MNSTMLLYWPTIHSDIFRHKHTDTHSCPFPSLSFSDLQEDGRVLLVQFHELQVGNGVNHPHGFASKCHRDGQQYHMVT